MPVPRLPPVAASPLPARGLSPLPAVADVAAGAPAGRPPVAAAPPGHPPHRDAHVRAVHAAQLPYQCAYCTVSFHHADTLERHERWHRLRGRSQSEEGEDTDASPQTKE